MAEPLASIFGTKQDRVNCLLSSRSAPPAMETAVPTSSIAHNLADTCHRQYVSRPDIITLDVDPQGQPIDPKKIQEHFEDCYEDGAQCVWRDQDTQCLWQSFYRMIGNVFQYKEEDQAAAALQELQGRFYLGQPIILDFSPVVDFREVTCRQFGSHHHRLKEGSAAGVCYARPPHYHMRAEEMERERDSDSHNHRRGDYRGGSGRRG